MKPIIGKGGKEWTKPVLTVLVRKDSGESILGACKSVSSAVTGGIHWSQCLTEIPSCRIQCLDSQVS